MKCFKIIYNMADLAHPTFKLSATKVTKTNSSTASYFCAGSTCILKFARQVPIYRILCVTFFFGTGYGVTLTYVIASYI